MKNNKSLVWGLIGLAVIILVALYAYNEDQKRRVAEAETTEEQKAGTPDKMEETDSAVNTADQPADDSTAASEDNAADSADNSSAETADTDSAAARTDTAPSDEADSAAAQTGAADETEKTEAADETDKTEEMMADSDVAQTAPASAAPTAPVADPQFDIVRVEPDGSTVIAGKAEAGTIVEVVTGDRVLAQSEVGQSGDFAAIFDDPLAPGDYEIVLRVIEEGEVVAQSQEVATVSVPEENPESLLVIVTKPGEASRILTQPEAVETASATDEQPAAPAAEVKETGTETVAASTADAGSKDDGSAPAKLSADTSAPEAETMAAKSDTDNSVSMGKDETGSETAKTGDTDTATPSTGSGSQVAALADTEDPADSKNTQASAKAEQPSPSEGTGSAATDAAAKADTSRDASAEAKLRIDAVEIEGGKVFVAGSATPGASVRVYADGTAIGDSPVSTTGRFLVEAERDISVGQHTISADLMMPGSDAATMRVAVPFTRPAGETVAAVAAPATSDAPEKMPDNAPKNETDEPAEQTAMATTDTAASAPTATKDPTEKTDADLTVKSEPAAPMTDADPAKNPQAGELAISDATERQDEPKDMAAAEIRQDTTVQAAETETTDKQAPQAPVETKTEKQSAMATNTESSSADASSSDDAVTEKSDTQRMTDTTAQAQSADTQDKPGAESGTGSPDTQVAAAETKSSEPQTVVQQALEPKEGSVIIRRGDTLWQISRRVYGRGVRYTTIYLANSDQISNPDFIEPGQIFMVPNEPLNNAEQLHRDRVKRR